jgi:hypothetical protein
MVRLVGRKFQEAAKLSFYIKKITAIIETMGHATNPRDFLDF